MNNEDWRKVGVGKKLKIMYEKLCREDIRCREDSLSPDMSPAKSVNSINSSDSSSQSALLSPVFRSAAAR